MAYTLAQQLESVQTAIRALESGTVKRYRIEGTEFEKHDLATLYAREERLLRLINEQGEIEQVVFEV